MMQSPSTHDLLSKKRPLARACVWMPLLFLGLWLINNLLYEASAGAIWTVWLGLAAAYLLFGVWPAIRQRDAERAVPLLLAAGLLMQLLFVLHMPHTFTMHDVDFFGSLEDSSINGGHLGIINYIVKFGRIPFENHTLDIYADYYHPVGYHLIQAIFFKLNTLLGISQEAAIENMQVVTLAFASGSMWMIYRILQDLGLSSRSIKMGLLFVVFQPALFIFAGTLNNDIAAVYFTLLAIRCTLWWMKSPTMKHIIYIALSLGFGMAVKLSIAPLAIPIGIIFAIYFFRDLKNWRKYLGQFAVFLLICAPLGLGRPLYHVLAYQAPLNNVPLPSEKIFVGDIPLSMRFGLPNRAAVTYIFFTPNRRINYNVWFQTLKTALFDELTLFPEQGSIMWFMSYLLAFLFTALIVLSAVLFIRMLISRKVSLPPFSRLLFSVYGLALLGGYIFFCLEYPYTCTFNFRYIIPILLLCALGLGTGFQKGSLPARIQEALTWAFGLVSVTVYVVYFLMR